MQKKEVEDLLNRYKQKVASEFSSKEESASQKENLYSSEYLAFKRAFMPRKFTLYEQACNFSASLLPLSPGKKAIPELEKAIKTSHLDITPVGATAFAIVGPLLFTIVASVIGYILSAIILPEPSIFPVIFSMMFGIVLIFVCRTIPFYLATTWRLKSSNQMVLSIFYTVTYMRHTSNLEGAIRFASNHLNPPLSLDFKRILWNIETGRHESVKDSLDEYLETWLATNGEFVESFHLIVSSLYESSEERRLNNLDKSLTVMLDGTFEKMLHYAHNLKSPINILNMLGIILPILGLVVLPLIVSFLTGSNTSPLFLAMVIGSIYCVALPIGVLYLGKSILTSRPTGYGEADITESDPELKKFKNIIIPLGPIQLNVNPMIVSLGIGFMLIVLGLFPLILHSVGVNDFGVGGPDGSTTCGKKLCFLDYHQSKATEGALVGTEVGPFGVGAAIMSLFFTLGIGVSIGLYYKLRSTAVYQIRVKNKKLEEEFASALFQLGNRLGDGLPAEMAFGKVADAMQGTISGEFMDLVHQNITRLGMSVEDALFDPKQGAIRYYPSPLIRSSMKVLTQSVKKGPKVAAQSLMNVSQYIKEIHRVNERLTDLLADSISSMESQTKFLAPAIAGIVVGITSMVTAILARLTILIENASSKGVSAGGLEGLATILGEGMPPFHFQLVVGLYVVEMIVILTILIVNIRSGEDPLESEYSLGVNVIKGTVLYCIITFVVMIVFNILAGVVLSGIVTAPGV